MQLTLVSEFRKQWAHDADEVMAMEAGTWSPGTAEFAAVANASAGKSVLRVNSLGTLLGALQTATGINRVNLITHAAPSMIGLRGSVDQFGEVTLVGDSGDAVGAGSITLWGINWLNDTGRSARDDIRKRFTADARFVIYGCNGGIAQGLAMLQELSRTFNIASSGFAGEIEYEPEYDIQKRIVLSRNRTRYEPYPIESRSAQFQAGFGHLKPDISQPRPPVPYR